VETGACFDRTGSYRYSLWRIWQADMLRILFVMLNPSTADAEINDPTIRRCLDFAQSWGYGSLEVVNLFGLRTTQPQRLRQAADPVGPDCDRYVQTAIERADTIIVAWGNWGNLQGRDQTVLNWIDPSRCYCLGVNQSGQPRHPLYLKRSTQPLRYAGMLA
jgi:hypothetical protein